MLESEASTRIVTQQQQQQGELPRAKRQASTEHVRRRGADTSPPRAKRQPSTEKLSSTSPPRAKRQGSSEKVSPPRPKRQGSSEKLAGGGNAATLAKPKKGERQEESSSGIQEKRQTKSSLTISQQRQRLPKQLQLRRHAKRPRQLLQQQQQQVTRTLRRRERVANAQNSDSLRRKMRSFQRTHLVLLPVKPLPPLRDAKRLLQHQRQQWSMKTVARN